MSEYTSLEKIRLEKINELVAEGIEPFPTRAERTHTSVRPLQPSKPPRRLHLKASCPRM